MHRTEGTNNAANLFVDGPPGTTVEENFLNALQEEIAGVVEGAGLTLKTAATETRDQLLAAMRALFIEPDSLTGKNAIINGDMRIGQRGASGSAAFTAATTPINDDDTYLLDRWLLLSDGNDIVDVSQGTEAPTGALLSCALDVETANKKFGILQVIEQQNCVHMIGDTVSLSFQAKVSSVAKLDNIKAMVISWDGAADTVTSDIISAWNGEGVTPTLEANWTAENVSTNLGVTAVWAKYIINNIAIDTVGAKNIGVFIWSDVTDTTTGHFLYITNIQLEKNPEASVYGMRSIGNELALCQRYFSKGFNQAIAPGTATAVSTETTRITALADADHTMELSVGFPVDMRSTPSIILYDEAGTAGKVRMKAGDGLAGTAGAEGTRNFIGGGTNGVAATDRYIVFLWTAESEL